MSEMVERVARALYAVNTGGAASWEDEAPEFQQWVCEQARAAIAAMREPTEAMVEEGASEIRAAGGPEFVWRAMIDAALKGRPA